VKRELRKKDHATKRQLERRGKVFAIVWRGTTHNRYRDFLKGDEYQSNSYIFPNGEKDERGKNKLTKKMEGKDVNK